MNLLIIHKDVPDIAFIIDSMLVNCKYIVVDLEKEDLKNIVQQIQNQFQNQLNFENIGIMRHNVNRPFFIQDLNTQNIHLVDPELKTWLKFSSFLYRLKKCFNLKNIDLISCDCYTSDWKYIIHFYKMKYGINIRTSVNETGLGGDWILESDNINLIGLYFTEQIVNYQHSLLGNLAPYDIVYIRDYKSSGSAIGYDVLVGYGKNEYGKMGTGSTGETFNTYTIINATSNKLYPTKTNPLMQISTSYMNTIELGKNGLYQIGNKINYLNKEYTIWQDYFEDSNNSFKSQTHKRKGGSQMINTTLRLKQSPCNKPIKYFEVGISSKPQLCNIAYNKPTRHYYYNASEEGAKWHIQHKHHYYTYSTHTWVDWFESDPILPEASYAQRGLLSFVEFMNSPAGIAVQVLLTLVSFSVTLLNPVQILTNSLNEIAFTYASSLSFLAGQEVKVAAELTVAAATNAIKTEAAVIASSAARTSAQKIVTSFTKFFTKDLISKYIALSMNFFTDIGVNQGLDIALVAIGSIFDVDAIAVFTKLIINVIIDSTNLRVLGVIALKGIVSIAIRRIGMYFQKFIFAIMFKEITDPIQENSANLRGIPNIVDISLKYEGQPEGTLAVPYSQPKNYYSQQPENDGYFIVYLDTDGQLWGIGDNTHGVVGPNVWNMQENYGPGMPYYRPRSGNRGGNAYLRKLGGGAYTNLVPYNQTFLVSQETITEKVKDYYKDAFGIKKSTYKWVEKTKLVDVYQTFYMKHVSCGDGYMIAIDSSGNLFGCGKNLYFQMPMQTTFYSIYGLTKLPSIDMFEKLGVTISHVVCGPRHCALILKMPINMVSVCGDSTYGQCGIINTKPEVYYHLIDSSTGYVGVPATLTGASPIALCIPNNESVLQVVCGLKCTAVLTTLRNVYIYGFDNPIPRKVLLNGGSNFVVHNKYVDPDPQTTYTKDYNLFVDISYSYDTVLNELAVSPNFYVDISLTYSNYISTDFPKNIFNINNYLYYDIVEKRYIPMDANKNQLTGTWDNINIDNSNNAIYNDRVSVYIHDTISNVSSIANIPKFIKIIDDTIILYCTDINDTIDNIVHISANKNIIYANQVSLDSNIINNGSRIIPGTYYFGHTLNEMYMYGYSYSDLVSYYYNEMNSFLLDGSLSLFDMLHFGMDIKTIAALNKFMPIDFKNEGIYLNDLIDIANQNISSKIYMNTIIDASWSIQNYIDAGITFEELITNPTFKQCNFTIKDFFDEGISISYFKDLLHITANMCRTNNRTAREVYDASYNIFEIINAGYTLFDLYEANISLLSIPKSFNYTIHNFIDASFSIEKLLDEKYFLLKEFVDYGVPLKTLINYYDSLLELKNAGFTIKEIGDASNVTDYSAFILQLLEAGFTINDLKTVNVVLNQLIPYVGSQITLTDLKQANFTANELKPYNYPITELKNVGYTATDMHDANYLVSQLLIPNGYTIKELLSGGYSVQELGLQASTFNVINDGTNKRKIYKM